MPNKARLWWVVSTASAFEQQQYDVKTTEDPKCRICILANKCIQNTCDPSYCQCASVLPQVSTTSSICQYPSAKIFILIDARKCLMLRQRVPTGARINARFNIFEACFFATAQQNLVAATALLGGARLIAFIVGATFQRTPSNDGFSLFCWKYRHQQQQIFFAGPWSIPTMRNKNNVVAVCWIYTFAVAGRCRYCAVWYLALADKINRDLEGVTKLAARAIRATRNAEDFGNLLKQTDTTIGL